MPATARAGPCGARGCGRPSTAGRPGSGRPGRPRRTERWPPARWSAARDRAPLPRSSRARCWYSTRVYTSGGGRGGAPPSSAALRSSSPAWVLGPSPRASRARLRAASGRTAGPAPSAPARAPPSGRRRRWRRPGPVAAPTRGRSCPRRAPAGPAPAQTPAARRALAWAASSVASSSGSSSISERQLDQAVGQPDVLGQQRAVEVGADHVARAHALEPVAPLLPWPESTRPSGCSPGRGRCGRRGSRSRRWCAGPCPGRPRWRSCRSGAGLPRGRSSDRRSRRRQLLVAELVAVPEQLVAAADGEHDLAAVARRGSA